MLDVGEITKLLNALYSSLESYLYKHSTGMKWNAGQQSIDSWYVYSSVRHPVHGCTSTQWLLNPSIQHDVYYILHLQLKFPKCYTEIYTIYIHQQL